VSDHLSYRLILILSPTRQLLGIRHAEGFSLGRVIVPRWTRQAEQLAKAIRAKWQLNVIILDTLPEELSGEACAVVEVRPDSGAVALSHFAAIDPADLSSAEFTEDERMVITSILSGERHSQGPFSRIGWFDEAQAWIRDAVGDRRVTFTKDVRQLNASARFALVRFETDEGTAYWLKAAGESDQREWRVTAALARMFPHYLPPLVAERKDWSAWVMEDAGAPVDENLIAPALEQAVVALAELQKSSLDHLDDLSAAGARDARIAVLQEHLEAIFDYLDKAMATQTSTKAMPLSSQELHELKHALRRACRTMESLCIPSSLVHGDINLGNVLLKNSQCRFIDWREAGIGNPFLTFYQLMAHIVRVDPSAQTWVPHLEERYKTQWLDHLSSSQINQATTIAPLLTILSCLYSGGEWLRSSRRDAPEVQSYARSLGRRMYRAAQSLPAEALRP
jgi:thiamine kinase-like enzyme